MDILDIAQIVAYFAYVNRIADGLGVAVEAEKWEEIRAAENAPRPVGEAASFARGEGENRKQAVG
jgi:hypothetical protein